MFRYLKAAFWARPELPGLGRLPINALVFFGLIVLGFGNPAFWLLALGLETFYLFLVSTHPRFQNLVNALDTADQLQDESKQTQDLTLQLNPAERKQFSVLEQKRLRLLRKYDDSRSDQFLIDANGEALDNLKSIYLKLLVSRHYLQEHQQEANASTLNTQISKLRTELQDTNSSHSLRESREATLNIYQQRLENIEKRTQAIAEIESDLNRIEAQVDLALENASMLGKTEVLSGKIDLVSRLLDDSIYNDSATVSQAVNESYTSTPEPPIRS